jgi:4-hydroxy-2-oxoheptanedioate aldolase
MKKSWKNGSQTFSFGPFIKCPHPEIIEACGLSGCDFAVVDMEHTPLSPTAIYPLVLAAEARQVDLIVRVPNRDEHYIRWCLDLAVPYIQIPHVQSPEDVQSVVKSSYFAPQGERGLCRFVRAANYSATEGRDYVTNAQTKTHLILQIEGRKGIEALPEIIDVPGFDFIFIGPYDLSQSLGCPGEIWNPRVTDKMLEVIAMCQERNIKVGTFTDSIEGIARWADKGVKMIQYASDLNIFMSGIAGIKNAVQGLASGSK